MENIWIDRAPGNGPEVYNILSDKGMEQWSRLGSVSHAVAPGSEDSLMVVRSAAGSPLSLSPNFKRSKP